MSEPTPLEREEYVEQGYFFRTFRTRMAEGIPSQQILASLRDEILATTRLPFAIDFMLAEMKHGGQFGTALVQLPHYFTPFQAFVMTQAESDESRLTMELALEILEREAAYRARGPLVPGLFVFQFETLCRNRLGYDRGLDCVAADSFYDGAWRDWIRKLRKQVGNADFAELVYARSEFAVVEMRRRVADYVSKWPILFGEKEGRIAKANWHKDPLYLFAALQRQLGYPEVPRPARRDETTLVLKALEQKVQQLEARVKVIDEELKGGIDLQAHTNRDS